MIKSNLSEVEKQSRYSSPLENYLINRCPGAQAGSEGLLVKNTKSQAKLGEFMDSLGF